MPAPHLSAEAPMSESVFQDAIFPSSSSTVWADMHRQQAQKFQEQEHRARAMAEHAQHQLAAAQSAVEAVGDLLEGFEAGLNPDEEMVLVIVGGPAGERIAPKEIAPSGPDRVLFTGIGSDGALVQVLQHVSQLNVMLKSVTVEGRPALRMFEIMPDERVEHET